MWIDIFFYGYIGFMVLLGIKRYVPSLKKLFNGHSIGEWGMYSIPVESRYYSASIGCQKQGFEGFQDLADITEISKKYLWHNFHRGQFVSIALPDFHKKAFNEFSKFLARQEEVKKIATKFHDKCGNLIVELSFSYRVGEKRFSHASKAKIEA